MLIRDAIEEYLGAKQNAITHSTWVWYDTFLTYFYEGASQHRLTRLEELSASHVKQFVSDCPTTNTHTRHARAQIVKAFLNWCARDEDMGWGRRLGWQCGVISTGGELTPVEMEPMSFSARTATHYQ